MSLRKILTVIFILAISLRLLYFKDSLTFFYDQGRDALAAMEIWQGDPVKIIGPQTDFLGLYHGPLYWYLISPFYYLSGGSVWMVRLFLIFLNCVSLFFIYDLTKDLFNKKNIALLAAFLFAISFEAIAYARWLSNPAPALLTTTISFWSLYKLIKGKSWALITLAVSWGLSIQFQLFLIYQILVFLIIWVFIKGFKPPKVSIKTYIYSIIGFLATVSTYIASEIKFNLQGTKVLINFFKTRSFPETNFIKIMEGYLNKIVNAFSLNIWGLNIFLAGLGILVTLYFSLYYIKNKEKRGEIIFLLCWILSPIFIVFFNGPNAHFITLGILPGVIILTSYLLYDVLLAKGDSLRRTTYQRSIHPRHKWRGFLECCYKLKTKKTIFFVVVMLLIISGNLNLILSKNKEGDTLFTVQKQMIIGDELKIVDWVYKEAQGEHFRLNTITYPLFINSTWAYLFNWYGGKTYGYMPYWWGETQVDVPGSNVIWSDDGGNDWLFLIIEPSSTGNDTWEKAIKLLEDTRSVTVKKENIGYFTVEKRRITNPERIYTSSDVFFVIKNTNINVLQQTK